MIDIYALQVGAMGTNCYLVRSEGSKEGIVIDPGDDADRIIAKADSLGITIKAILLTHGHFDHIFAVNQIREHYSAPVYASTDEAELLGNKDMNCSKRVRRPVELAADVLLGDGETFDLAGLDIKTISTPGHTRGSVCFYLENEQVLFSGDTLFCESIGRTDLPTGNGHLIMESLRDKLAVLPDEVQVFSGHGESTTIGYEKRNNSYMRGGYFYE